MLVAYYHVLLALNSRSTLDELIPGVNKVIRHGAASNEELTAVIGAELWYLSFSRLVNAL